MHGLFRDRFLPRWINVEHQLNPRNFVTTAWFMKSFRSWNELILIHSIKLANKKSFQQKQTRVKEYWLKSLSQSCKATKQWEQKPERDVECVIWWYCAKMIKKKKKIKNNEVFKMHFITHILNFLQFRNGMRVYNRSVLSSYPLKRQRKEKPIKENMRSDVKGTALI